MAKTVIGVFQNRETAAATVDDLELAGLDRDNIKLLSGTDLDADDVKKKGRMGAGEKLKGFFSDIGLSQKEIGMSEEDAEFYAERLQMGHSLVIAKCMDEQADPAFTIMESRGAMADETTGNVPWTGTEQQQFGTGKVGTGKAVPVVKEDVNIGKQQVSLGGLRVYSRPVEHQVQKDVALREEHAHVERKPVDRPATAADLQGDTTLEVTESAEIPTISKQARVIEEVTLDKEVSETTQRVETTARGTEVEVQNLGSGRFEDYDKDFRSNYETAYGTGGLGYEAYTPAYRYGYDLASSERYRQHGDWSLLENDARTQWETRNAGTWEKFKDAIRYGWQRARGKGPERTSQPGRPLTRDSGVRR